MSINRIGIDSNADQTVLLTCASAADDSVNDAVDMAVFTGFEDAQVAGEPDLIVELIDLYLEDTPHRMVVMQAAIEETDEMSLRRVAHSLKGSSANLGARRMAALCEQLERIDCYDSFQKGGALLIQLEREFERVRQLFTAERQRRL